MEKVGRSRLDGKFGGCNPPKFNITPENDGLEDVFPFPRGAFSGSMLIFQDVFINGFPGLITPSFSPYYLGEFLLIWGQLLKWW